jgi:hypothetical protein
VCVSDDDEIIELSQSCPKKVCHDQPTSPSRFISLNMIILYISLIIIVMCVLVMMMKLLN